MVDLNGTVEDGTRLMAWAEDQFTGKVNAMPIGDAEPSILMQVGYAMPQSTSKHCSFDGTECWTVKNLPSITSISADQGYVSGGQTLVIQGNGFQSSSDINVKVDGVPCQVIANDQSSLTCITGASETNSTVVDGFG